MSKIYIGTSGYSYKHWYEVFYPSKLKPGEMLAYYANYLDTVEINSTFYRLPFENIVAGWKKKTPENFTFALKASRVVTHYQKLVDIEEALETFYNRISPLEEKIGVILYQLPPSLKIDIPRLKNFLGKLPSDYRHAIEFRDDSWIEEEVFHTLEEIGIAYCIVSAPKKKCYLKATSDFAYIRMHGVSQWYAYNYTESDLIWWAEKIINFLKEGVSVYIYFNNDAYGYAVKNALMLKELLQKG